MKKIVACGGLATKVNEAFTSSWPSKLQHLYEAQQGRMAASRAKLVSPKKGCPIATGSPIVLQHNPGHQLLRHRCVECFVFLEISEPSLRVHRVGLGEDEREYVVRRDTPAAGAIASIGLAVVETGQRLKGLSKAVLSQVCVCFVVDMFATTGMPPNS